jgi:uncharacterized protein (DUF2062 family)
MSRLTKWVRAQAPSRESFEKSRFLKPFAQRVFHPALWRFTRRSVPRGVALGLLVGIFFLVPGVQIIGAALFALPLRANVPVAAAMTFLSNPLTTPFLIAAALFVGNATLHLGADLSQFEALMDQHASVQAWIGWFLSSAAPALLWGLLIIAALAALIGYIIAVWAWRFWLIRKWQTRRRRRGLSAP